MNAGADPRQGRSRTYAAAQISHLAEHRDRAALNRAWTAMFPDPATMPARQVIAASLDGGALMHTDLIARLD